MGAKPSKARTPKDSSHIASRKHGRSSRLSILLTTPHGSGTHAPHSPHHSPLADSPKKKKKEARYRLFVQGSRRFGWCLWESHDLPKPSQLGKKRQWRSTTPPRLQRGWDFMLGINASSSRSQAERDSYMRIAHWIADVIEAGAVGSTAGGVGVEDIGPLLRRQSGMDHVQGDDAHSHDRGNDAGAGGGGGECEHQRYCLDGGQGFDAVGPTAADWPAVADKASTCLDISKDTVMPLEFVTAT
ncbi:hypothetical protein SYNPS1DRAFT_26086, partial [Syncephalis pseudoplumigaleata]